jgi:hypothetical protein
VLALLWLIQLNRSLQDQGEKLAQIGYSVERSSALQRLALETLVAQSADQAKANGPDDFLTQYRRTSLALDHTKEKLEQQVTINGELAAKVQTLATANTKLKTDLDRAKTYESDAKEAAKLRDKLDDLETENKNQASKLADQQEILDAIPARGAERLRRQYNRAWYAAAAGWSFAGILALGLAAAYGLKPLPDPDATVPSPSPMVPPEPQDDEPPPHHIT